MTTHWNIHNIPSLQNRVALVTGGNSGVGYQTALALARAGTHTLIASRNAKKCAQAVDAIRHAFPHAHVETIALDLSDLASVRACAETFRARFQTLDILVNNAGVMAVPYLRTADGFEMQFGTNHLGHFALTGWLLPAILATAGARVVTVSSNMHLFGKIDFGNLDGRKKYDRWGAYCASKLANLWFTYELERKFRQSGVNAISVGCHPGYAATNLQYAGARLENARWRETMFRVINRLFATDAAHGAQSLIYAATSEDIHGGDFIGPDGLFGARGKPVHSRSGKQSYDEAQAAKLWQVSEALTGVSYAFTNEL